MPLQLIHGAFYRKPDGQVIRAMLNENGLFDFHNPNGQVELAMAKPLQFVNLERSNRDEFNGQGPDSREEPEYAHPEDGGAPTPPPAVSSKRKRRRNKRKASAPDAVTRPGQELGSDEEQ